MTVWNLDEVDQVKSATTRLRFDLESVEQMTASFVTDYMLREFRAGLKKHGFQDQVHHDNCVLEQTKLESEKVLEVTIVWRPETNLIYFIDGGPTDTLREISGAPKIKVDLVRYPNVGERSSEGTGVVTMMKETFSCVGWDPDHKAWAYKLETTS